MTEGEESHRQISSVAVRTRTIRRKSASATNAVWPGKKVSQENVLRACLQITPSVNLLSHIFMCSFFVIRLDI